MWRVVARDRGWQLDLLPLGGQSIEQDLANRDFTINAIAEPVGGGDAVDPFGGPATTWASALRMVSPDAFTRDPLRALRLARLACELDFTVEPATAAGRGEKRTGACGTWRPSGSSRSSSA